MSTMWFMSVLVLLLLDVRIKALEQDIQPHRCHQCFPSNSTTCQHSEAGWLSATCPSARPYCATVAIPPDFGSSLGCAAATAAPCSLANSPRQTLELTCICVGHLCNAPFSLKLRNELLNFSSANSNESALTDRFFKLSRFANVSAADLYKAITVGIDVNSTVTTESAGLGDLPKAEALKQQTAPSDDEEDEGEGSGAYEDPRRTQGQAASAPAAPSSYLPADANKAISLSTILAPLAFIHLAF